MSNNNNTLQNYFAALNNHFNEVSNFNNQTIALLNSTKLLDLFCENLGTQVFNETFDKNKSTNIEKLLVTIKEIGSDSKYYLQKLSTYIFILDNLITFVAEVAE